MPKELAFYTYHAVEAEAHGLQRHGFSRARQEVPFERGMPLIGLIRGLIRMLHRGHQDKEGLCGLMAALPDHYDAARHEGTKRDSPE
jgi:hypothetical protein